MSSSAADADTKGFLADLADAAAARWREPDQGIWEMRGGPQHFLYSKLMCWVALDRAIALADVLDAHRRVDALEARPLTRSPTPSRPAGGASRRRRFTQAFDSDHLDASVLMMPIVGFIDPRDPRMLARRWMPSRNTHR